MGVLSSYDLSRALAEKLGVPFVDLAESTIDDIAAQSLPERVARRYQALPIGVHDDKVVVAMTFPGDVVAVDDIRTILGSAIAPVVAEPEQLAAAIDRTWAGSRIASSVDAAHTEAEDPEVATSIADVDDAPLVRLVNAIMGRAIDEGASDVHIQPEPQRVRIRIRVDGVLRDVSETPRSVLRPMISRLKIQAGLDITQTRIPQDGRFSITVDGRRVDARIATLPTGHGEAAVLRLLDERSGVFGFEELGFRPEELERYEQAFSVPQGTIITSGPTGSGKTSTLYATLLTVNTPDRNIISVEDPIEYKIEGTKQMQIDVKSGMTFPTALRSILRADPDVILVGEIRDLETARIAAEAALTGHLVLSSIHTTRASAVPLRLIDMGVEPYLVTSALTCTVGQRLARKLCPRCSEPDVLDRTVVESLRLPEELVERGDIRRAVGCSYCSGSGYRGRTAIYEVMLMTEEISRLVLGRASSHDIERWAVADGMDTLRTAALKRVADGVLSLEEMLRVVV
ncbi:MAG: GspE/PulE family protein [Acidimicrobiia bacterium]|nr:GspE/PulE family protein [Acidimicrobiia bacterium]